MPKSVTAKPQLELSALTFQEFQLIHERTMRIMLMLLFFQPSFSWANCQARLDGAKAWRLTRDLMPDIFRREGSLVEIKMTSKKQYEKLLFKKLEEEVAEFENDPSPEELADVKEVVLSIIKHFALNQADENEITEVWRERLLKHGLDEAQVEKMRIQKRQKKGGFEKGFMIRALRKRQRARTQKF